MRQNIIIKKMREERKLFGESRCYLVELIDSSVFNIGILVIFVIGKGIKDEN